MSDEPNNVMNIQVPSGIKRKWSEDEDNQLEECVQRKGAKGWNKISSMLPGRTAKQCRERWHHKVNPNIKKGDWSPHEDQIILMSYPIFQHSWTKMAKLLPGRTGNDVKNRYYALERHRRDYVDSNNEIVNELLELKTPNLNPYSSSSSSSSYSIKYDKQKPSYWPSINNNLSSNTVVSDDEGNNEIDNFPNMSTGSHFKEPKLMPQSNLNSSKNQPVAHIDNNNNIDSFQNNYSKICLPSISDLFSEYLPTTVNMNSNSTSTAVVGNHSSPSLSSFVLSSSSSLLLSGSGYDHLNSNPCAITNNNHHTNSFQHHLQQHGEPVCEVFTHLSPEDTHATITHYPNIITLKEGAQVSNSIIDDRHSNNKKPHVKNVVNVPFVYDTCKVMRS